MHLELGVVGILLDLDTFGILPLGFQEEVLDLFDFSQHFVILEKKIYYQTRSIYVKIIPLRAK